MNSNRVNLTLTFSAALAGLALTVLTPMAHGHGNNPTFSDTKPTTGTPPPGPTANPNIDTFGEPPQDLPDALESIVNPGIVIGIGVTIEESFDALSQVVSEPMAIDLVINPVVDLAPQIAAELTDASGSGSITVPMPNVIPAPGTLALLGLAAAAAGRRRRRR